MNSHFGKITGWPVTLFVQLTRAKYGMLHEHTLIPKSVE